MTNKIKNSIVFLTAYPIEYGPSQRFRLSIYLDRLKKDGYKFSVHSFYTKSDWAFIHSGGFVFKKVLATILGYLRRCFCLPKMLMADYIFIQRETSPLGPPILAFFLKNIFQKKIIFDFDDAIWIENFSEQNAKIQKLKFYSKTKSYIKWSYKVVAGNKYLKEYAKNYNSRVEIIPTIVDLELRKKSLKKKNEITCIGWTGSFSSEHHLELLKEVIEDLALKFSFKLKIISNRRPQIKFKNCQIEYVEWQRETELEELGDIDIGLMPLKGDFEFAKGKCGFKIIQYMSMGIVPLASPVGVNKEIIKHRVNGFLCNSKEEWRDYLTLLLKKDINLSSMIREAEETVESQYSLNTNYPKFKALFE